ncbi:MAG: hypothetical protein JNK75_06140 [Betaproteobacteria bacterium]|nr:hypothetical protein [Betaproteobacteria bacterium]
MKRLRIALGAACSALVFLAPLHATAQEAVVTNRMTELRAGPDESARVVRPLADKTAVQALQRRGAWTQIRVGMDTGWVRMMHLRGGATVVEGERTSGGGFLSGFQRLLAGDAGSRNTRGQGATLGIRGFSKDDVAKAEFNPVEFEKLKRHQVSGGEAQRFAAQANLAFRSVTYLAQDAIELQGKGGTK